MSEDPSETPKLPANISGVDSQPNFQIGSDSHPFGLDAPSSYAEVRTSDDNHSLGALIKTARGGYLFQANYSYWDRGFFEFCKKGLNALDIFDLLKIDVGQMNLTRLFDTFPDQYVSFCFDFLSTLPNVSAATIDDHLQTRLNKPIGSSIDLVPQDVHEITKAISQGYSNTGEDLYENFMVPIFNAHPHNDPDIPVHIEHSVGSSQSCSLKFGVFGLAGSFGSHEEIEITTRSISPYKNSVQFQTNLPIRVRRWEKPNDQGSFVFYTYVFEGGRSGLIHRTTQDKNDYIPYNKNRKARFKFDIQHSDNSGEPFECDFKIREQGTDTFSFEANISGIKTEFFVNSTAMNSIKLTYVHPGNGVLSFCGAHDSCHDILPVFEKISDKS